MDEIFKAEAWEKLWTYRSTFLTGFGNTLRTAAAALVLALLLVSQRVARWLSG